MKPMKLGSKTMICYTARGFRRFSSTEDHQERRLSRSRASIVNNFFRYWVPVVFYAGLIIALSSLPKVATPSFLELNDKLFHAMEYSVLGALCYRAYRYGAGSIEGRLAVGLAILSAAVFGITDEYHQSFVPLREPDRWDWGADVIGSVFGAIAWHRLQRSS